MVPHCIRSFFHFSSTHIALFRDYMCSNTSWTGSCPRPLRGDPCDDHGHAGWAADAARRPATEDDSNRATATQRHSQQLDSGTPPFRGAAPPAAAGNTHDDANEGNQTQRTRPPSADVGPQRNTTHSTQETVPTGCTRHSSPTAKLNEHAGGLNCPPHRPPAGPLSAHAAQQNADATACSDARRDTW